MDARLRISRRGAPSGTGVVALTAQDDTAAGGDWFDVIPTPTGRLALVVGDVVGHGVTASATMGQLRALLRARLATGTGPATAVAELDTFTRIVTGARAATVCVAELDPATGTLRYNTAGHPAPILLAADGTATYLTPTPTAPLATAPPTDTVHEAVTAEVPPGGALLLYSDGILERPGITITTGQDALLRTARDAFRNTVLPVGAPERAAERLCAQALELLTRYTGHSDDNTLLAAHRTDPTPPLTLRLPAASGSLAELRFELGLWLLNLGIDGAQEIEIQHAVGELATNAIEHAYNTAPEGAHPTPPPADATVEVRADIDAGGKATITVIDQGRWREPGSADAYRGHGLTLVEAFGELTLTHDAGTRARFTRALTHPVALDRTSTHPTPAPPRRPPDRRRPRRPRPHHPDRSGGQGHRGRMRRPAPQGLPWGHHRPDRRPDRRRPPRQLRGEGPVPPAGRRPRQRHHPHPHRPRRLSRRHDPRPRPPPPHPLRVPRTL
ncbi:SpoIIE family protein phosphatase [Streptomyces sp. NPDC097619]|uniref:SpoIIE family protein phosphatase n=1 Tax=Streptomyces sp. NPDC097619 TaxID=3157228 RepID=UPI00332B26E1